MCVSLDGKLLHGNGFRCFVNVAFAVPGLEDNGMGRFGHAYCGGNLAGGSGSHADIVHVNPHEGDWIGRSSTRRQVHARSRDRAACGGRNLDHGCGSSGGYSSTGVALEEFTHVWRGIGGSGEVCRGAHGFQDRPQNALMVIIRGRFITGFHLRADHRHHDVTAATSQHRCAAAIVSAQVGFICPDDEHAVAARLEWRRGEQRANRVLQELVGCRRGKRPGSLRNYACHCCRQG